MTDMGCAEANSADVRDGTQEGGDFSSSYITWDTNLADTLQCAKDLLLCEVTSLLMCILQGQMQRLRLGPWPIVFLTFAIFCASTCSLYQPRPGLLLVFPFFLFFLSWCWQALDRVPRPESLQGLQPAVLFPVHFPMQAVFLVPRAQGLYDFLS